MNAFGWQSINVIVQSVIQLIFNALLARLISKESFGIMAIVLIITGFIDIFAQIGIGPAIIQKKEITKSEISGSFYLSAILGIIFFYLSQSLLLNQTNNLVKNLYEVPMVLYHTNIYGIGPNFWHVGYNLIYNFFIQLKRPTKSASQFFNF